MCSNTASALSNNQNKPANTNDTTIKPPQSNKTSSESLTTKKLIRRAAMIAKTIENSVNLRFDDKSCCRITALAGCCKLKYAGTTAKPIKKRPARKTPKGRK